MNPKVGLAALEITGRCGELAEAGRVIRSPCSSALWQRPGEKEGKLDAEESAPAV